MEDTFRSRLELHVGTVRHILADAMSVNVHEEVNGAFYVTFTYPRQDDDADRYAALVEGNDVAFPSDVERGQRFRIRKVDEIRQGQKIYKVVEAHHIAFTLGNYFLDSYIDFAAAKTLADMLAMLQADTPFTFAIDGSFSAQDIFDFGEKKKIDLLQELRQLYGAELSFDNYTITLTSRKGGNYGARIRYRHNLKGITRKSHDMERITRLYGYGKNGLTIEGYAGHSTKYIDSTYYDSENPFMGKVEFSEIDSQARLLLEMHKHLAKYELPAVSYEVDFVQMEKVDRDFESERIREAGDAVTCYDEDLGYSFDARAIVFDREPFDRRSGHVTLANFRELKMSDYIFQATVGSKKAIAFANKNTVLKGQKYDDSITLVDGLGMKVTDDDNIERVRIGQVGAGQYGLRVDSGYIEITGGLPDEQVAGADGWNGRTTLLTPSGIYTGTIEADQISATSLSAISADLGTITGGSIYGSYIATSQTFPKVEFSSTSNFIKASQDDNHYVLVSPFGAGTPAIQIFDGIASKSLLCYVASGGGVVAAIGDLQLAATGGYVRVASWSSLYGNGNNQTLQTAIDTLQTQIYLKANAFSGLSGRIYVAVTDGGPAEFPIDLVNGVCT